MASTMRIHGIIHGSRVNGPGIRSVIHTQGCSLRCPGCFNPETWDPRAGHAMTLQAIEAQVLQAQSDGVTVSGGEPTDQMEALVALCRRLQARGLSIVVFSGRTREEIARMRLGEALLSSIDVLIDGRFERDQPAGQGLRGSANQRIHLLTTRYRLEDFASREVEIHLSPGGEIRTTGFPDPALVGALRHLSRPGEDGS